LGLERLGKSAGGADFVSPELALSEVEGRQRWVTISSRHPERQQARHKNLNNSPDLLIQ
jgi:hypothetical protein